MKQNWENFLFLCLPSVEKRNPRSHLYWRRFLPFPSQKPQKRFRPWQGGWQSMIESPFPCCITWEQKFFQLSNENQRGVMTLWMRNTCEWRQVLWVIFCEVGDEGSSPDCTAVGREMINASSPDAFIFAGRGVHRIKVINSWSIPCKTADGRWFHKHWYC